MRTEPRSPAHAAAAITAALMATVLGACGTSGPGSGSAPTPVTSSVTAPPTSVPPPASSSAPTPSAAVDLLVPPKVAGYTYGDVDASSALPGMTQALVESINQSNPGFVTGHSDHKVLKEGEHVHNLLLLRVDMAAAGDLTRAQIVEGLLQWALGHQFPDFSERTLAGQWVGAAHVTVNGQDRAAVVWPGHDTIALVVGPSQPEAEAFLAALISARTT